MVPESVKSSRFRKLVFGILYLSVQFGQIKNQNTIFTPIFNPNLTQELFKLKSVFMINFFEKINVINFFLKIPVFLTRRAYPEPKPNFAKPEM